MEKTAFFSQHLPDLNFDLDSNTNSNEMEVESVVHPELTARPDVHEKNQKTKTKMTTTTAGAATATTTKVSSAECKENKPKETQLKLFSDCNFLNLNKKLASGGSTSKLQQVVAEPPKNFKKSLKYFIQSKQCV